MSSQLDTITEYVKVPEFNREKLQKTYKSAVNEFSGDKVEAQVMKIKDNKKAIVTIDKTEICLEDLKNGEKITVCVGKKHRKTLWKRSFAVVYQ